MKKTNVFALALLFAAAFTALTRLQAAAAEFAIHDGDKVVMMGDSITEQRLYSSYVETWALTRFPAWDLRFFNVGIGGDGATGGSQRFNRDVVGRGATAMTVNFGMNDCGGPGSHFDENRYKEFRTSMQKIADQAKAAHIRVAWRTTTPAEVMDEGPSVLPYIQNLEKFSGAVKEIAATNGNALFIDQFHPFVAAIDKVRAANPKNRIGGGDVVHSGSPGQALMAAAILKDMGKEFITNAKFGIFVHYTVEYAHLSPAGKPQPAVWDLDAKADAFDVKAFADAVEGMGAQYVTLTSFHAAMYLLAPSKVMVDAGLSKHQAKRDLIGEVADELNKRGIALCLYVHPTDQHDLSREERALFGWGPEVNGLPGPKLGQWPNPKWDDFLLGLFKEISLRYGKRVSGYWIDQHSGKVFPDAGRLAVALRAGNPDAVIWQNAGAYVPAGLSLESAWPACEGGDPSHGEKDQCCILPTDNAWFLGKKVQIPASEVFRGVVRCAGTPGQKGGVHVALTPYADAYAPPVKQMMDDFGKLWRERKVSLLNTKASKILQIEQKSNPWEIVATDSADGKTVYVHVMIPPAAQTLHLPPLNDSRKLLAATILLGCKEVKFKQSEEALELSLPADVKWDPVDTVIVLKVGPAFEPGVILSEDATLEISSTCGHDVAANHARLFSGEKVPFAFHTDNEKNPWAKIDLGAVRTVRTVEIENRQGEEERTKCLIMSISEDGVKWEEVWQAKNWVTTWLARVTQSSDGTVKSGRKARFIKLETSGESPRPLVLKRVTVFGVK